MFLRLMPAVAARTAMLTMVAALAIAAGACVKTKAETVPESPPLSMPPPPARVLAPSGDEEPLATAPPADVPPVTTPPRTRPTPPPRRSNAGAAPAPDTESRPQEAATPPAPAPAAPTPAEPPRELRSVDAAAEQKVRDLLQRASRDLSRVDYQKLSLDGRSQYEQSKRFADQAEQALKERNTVFAATLADKAAALAAELSGR